MLSSLSAAKKAEIKAWEEETVPCSHTKELVQQTNNTAAGVRDTSACTDCGLQENLWLCLTCGNLGCGRQQFGGTGGHGHGLKHFESTGNTHPVAVKLGTITPDGTAGN